MCMTTLHWRGWAYVDERRSREKRERTNEDDDDDDDNSSFCYVIRGYYMSCAMTTMIAWFVYIYIIIIAIIIIIVIIITKHSFEFVASSQLVPRTTEEWANVADLGSQVSHSSFQVVFLHIITHSSILPRRW